MKFSCQTRHHTIQSSYWPKKSMLFDTNHCHPRLYTLWVLCILIHTISIFITKCRPTVICFLVSKAIVISATRKIPPSSLAEMIFHFCKFLVLHFSYLKLSFHWYFSSELYFCFLFLENCRIHIIRNSYTGSHKKGCASSRYRIQRFTIHA